MFSNLKKILCALKLFGFVPTISVDLIKDNDSINLLFKNISHSLATDREGKIELTSLACEVPLKGRRVCLDAICNKQPCEKKKQKLAQHLLCKLK